MTSYRITRCLTAAVLVLGVLVRVLPVDAQKTTVPGSMLAVKPETAWWMSQLHLARQFGDRALAGLRESPVDDATPVDEHVLQAARDTYVLLRSARSGIEMARGDRRYAGPVTDLVFARVDEAWVLARAPVDRITWSNTRAEYLDVSITSLRRSLQLMDQVFVLMP
jgi:hypothetical protein